MVSPNFTKLLWVRFYQTGTTLSDQFDNTTLSYVLYFGKLFRGIVPIVVEFNIKQSFWPDQY